MTLEDILAPPGRILLIGEKGPELDAFKRAGWSGVSVNPRGTWGAAGLQDDDYYGRITYVEGVVSPEPHFIRTVEGFWVRPITVKEIFEQWGAVRFDIICVADVMLVRTAWYSEQIQAHLPGLYLLRDDGHNESVVKLAADRGYAHVFLEGGLLLLHREKM